MVCVDIFQAWFTLPRRLKPSFENGVSRLLAIASTMKVRNKINSSKATATTEYSMVSICQCSINVHIAPNYSAFHTDIEVRGG